MRRAGFGVTGEELEPLSLRPYEDIVEDLLHPERFEPVDEGRHLPLLRHPLGGPDFGRRGLAVPDG